MRRAVVAVLVASCVSPSDVFHCTPGDNAACVAADGTQGLCEMTGNCAFPDPACGDQGFRYDASADPGRGGVCELAVTAATMTAPAPISKTQPLEFELTTPPQMIVFDTGVNGTNKLVQLHMFTGPCPSGTGELGTTPAGCTNQLVARIVVDFTTPGVYCLVATDDNPASGDEIGLRLFASSTPPTCVR